MKKALLYLRVSTTMQEERDSLSKQKEESLSFIKNQKLELYKIIEEVESGRKTQRSGLQELEKEIKNKNFDVLIFYSLSRLGRVQYDIHKIINLAQSNHISYFSVTESFINSESELNRMMLGIMASLAEQESATTSKRVRDRMRTYASQGYFLQAPPIGYDVIDKILIANSDSSTVQDIFLSFASGESMTSIAHRYNKHQSFISNVLKNPAYGGFIQFGGRKKDKFTGKVIKTTPEIFKGLHKAIIEEELYNLVHKILLDSYIRPIRGRDDSAYLLGGLIKCTCGLGFYGQKAYTRKKVQRQKSYYRCSGTSVGKCKAPYIVVDDIESAVVETIKDYAKNNFDFLDQTSDNKKSEVSQIKKISQLTSKKKRIVEAYTDGNLSREEYLKKIKKIDSEISLIEDNKNKVIDIKNLKAHFINLLDHFDSVSKEEQKGILRIIINKIIIHSKEEFEIVLNIK
ncbi:MAG: recombinase family protein [Cetobacterium sp.]